jgi:hypothetical protein
MENGKKALVKEHLLAKCIFGCLLSILRYLTCCLSLIFIIGGNQKNTCFWRFCAGDSGSATPETPVFTHRNLWSGSGDSGLRLRGRFSSGVARPRYGGGDFGRKLRRKFVSGPETPVLATDPGDSGLCTPETPA